MRSGGLGTVRLWAYPILLAGVALVFDAADRRVPFGLISSGLLDEVAHLATAALGLMVLVCFIDVPRRFYVAASLHQSPSTSITSSLPRALGNPGQRPVTHSLATVAVFAVAAAASRRHRAVLAGVAVGLVLHFARDIAEGPPGVRMLWPLQQTAWTASYGWFLGMIIAFTAARLVLVSTGIPHRRIRLFQPPAAPDRGNDRGEVAGTPDSERHARLHLGWRGARPGASSMTARTPSWL